MAADAAALAVEIFAFAEGPADIIANEDHVRGVAGLTSGFHVSLGNNGQSQCS